jgi:thiamine biosynthesis lipoprotein
VFLVAEDSPRAQEGLEAAKVLIDASEQRFSRFLPDSEISALNAAAGTWHPVSSDLLEMLQQAQGFWAETQGLFDPSILTDLKRAGYDRSMDEIRLNGPLSGTAESSATSSRPQFGEAELDALRTYADACAVNAGGDIVFAGMPADGSQWHVAIEDPLDAQQHVAELRMGAGAVATSSVGKRRWVQGGVERHHLIDPRTGEPAQGRWLSVTVAAPWIATAEVYAKALLIGGEAEAPRLLAAHPEISYYTVDHDHKVAENPVRVEYS